VGGVKLNVKRVTVRESSRIYRVKSVDVQEGLESVMREHAYVSHVELTTFASIDTTSTNPSNCVLLGS